MAQLFQRHCLLFWSNLLIFYINLGSSQMRCTSHWTAYSNGTPTIKEDSSKILIFGRVSLPLANIRDVMDRVSEQIVNYFHIPMYINKMSKIVFFFRCLILYIPDKIKFSCMVYIVLNATIFSQGGRGQWTVNYTGTQSWVLLFGWCMSKLL